MSDLEDEVPGSEPGWFKDPEGEAAERLWDGLKWTSEVRGFPPPKEKPEETTPSSSGDSPKAPAKPEKDGGAMRRSIRKRPVVWVVSTGLIALFLGVGIGASDTTELDEKNERITALETELNAAEAVAEDAAQQKAQLSAKESQLDKREAGLEKAEATQKRNTITDGIWKVGTDFDSGTYRAEGGEGCYWALLGSADTSDIVNNGGFGPNQTVTIDSPWFETNGCGEWAKIG
jgi:hypothetical protein